VVSEDFRVRIRQEHDDVLDAVLGKVAHNIIDKRLAPDRNHPLRNIAGKGREAGPRSARKHERLQRAKPFPGPPHAIL